MNKKAVLIALGSALAAVGAYFAYKRKDEILAKLSDLQESLKEIELTEKAKTAFNEVVEKLTSLVKRGEELTEEQRAKEIAELEEKVKKLEEAVKTES